MKKLFTFLLIISISTSSFSYNGHKIDEYEIRYIKESIHLNNSIQYQLRNSNQWKTFLNKNPNWFVYFNEHNHLPHRAFGASISTSSPSDFIQNNLNIFNVNNTELILTSSSENEKYKNFNYTQYYKGLEILDSRLYIKMTQNNEVVVFGLDVFPDLKLSINSTILKDAAVISASQNLPFNITKHNVESELKILPIPVNGKYEFHLVYVVNISTKNHIGPAEYLCYVDANSGDLLMRNNKIKFEATTANVHVEGEVYTTNPFNPSFVKDMVDLKVYDVSASNSFYTDANGDVTLPSSNGNMYVSLEGRFSKVMTNSITPVISTTIGTTNNIVFDNSNSTIQERTAFYAVNQIHTHFKNQFPTFTQLDYPMETNVDIGLQGGCNAFYSGGTINFLEEDGGCQATANIPDVAYHEYGHAINDFRYNSGGGLWNGACGEGFADIWALSLTNYPVLGEGWLLNDPLSNVRTYDGLPKIYPQDLVGEVHADGEIICGAFWDTYLNLGNMQQALDLFTNLYDGGPDGPNGTEGIVFTDILLEFLYSDDNDGNIFNGTPNDIAIVSAFALHGITLLSNAVISHNPISNNIGNSAISINASVGITYPWALGSTNCFYRLNDATNWNNLVMSGASSFTTTIPAQPNGTVVAYYISLTDNFGNESGITPMAANVSPLNNANIPYFIMVGYDLIEEEDFDFSMGFWQTGDVNDNATTGLWEIGSPVGSYTDNGSPVQTDQQHTPNGSDCAFTGNATSSTASIGENDIDGGHTTLYSPTYDLSSYINPAFSYWRWFTNNTGAEPNADWWQVSITGDGVNWESIENNLTSDISWRRFAFRVKDYISLNSTQVQLKFVASDSTNGSLSGGSLVEAAIDDLMLYETQSVTSSSFNDVLSTEPKLIKITDILGKEINIKTIAKYTTLLYIYNDGSVEKRIYLKK